MDLSENKHYQVVYDPKQVKKFATIFLPKSTQQCLVIYLCARRKYDQNLSKSQLILNRTIIHGGRDDSLQDIGDNFVRKLYRHHVPIGSYVHDSNIPISQEAMCTYALLVPKDPIKAMTKVLPKFVESLIERTVVPKPFNALVNEVGKTNAVVPKEEQLMMVDLDTKDQEHLEQTRDLLVASNVSKHVKICIETRGGYHIIYTKGGDIDSKRLFDFKLATKFLKPNVHGDMVPDYWFSLAKAAMSIIPGTLQGGFKARICEDFFEES